MASLLSKKIMDAWLGFAKLHLNKLQVFYRLDREDQSGHNAQQHNIPNSLQLSSKGGGGVIILGMNLDTLQPLSQL